MKWVKIDNYYDGVVYLKRSKIEHISIHYVDDMDGKGWEIFVACEFEGEKGRIISMTENPIKWLWLAKLIMWWRLL